MQGSRTACITQNLTHTSGCPARRFLRHMYVSPRVTTPLVLPSRPSLPKAWPTIPLHFAPASILQDIKISTFRLMLLLFGHVVGLMQGVYFISIIGFGLLSCVIHPSPSFSAWCVHQMSRILGTMSDQTFTAQWKWVKLQGGRREGGTGGRVGRTERSEEEAGTEESLRPFCAADRS